MCILFVFMDVYQWLYIVCMVSESCGCTNGVNMGCCFIYRGTEELLVPEVHR